MTAKKNRLFSLAGGAFTFAEAWGETPRLFEWE